MAETNKADIGNDNGENDRLIVIPYENIQGIIGRYNQVIEYKLNNLVFRNIINNSFHQYALLASGLTPSRLPFLIGVKVELQSVKNDPSNENITILLLRIIEGVQIDIKSLELLGQGITMANYSVMNINGFSDIQKEVEQLILEIKYIQDEHMPVLPLLKASWNTESIARYSYQLCFFIVSAISEFVKIDNLEEFFCGHSHIILRRARYELLKYLKIRAKEDQEKKDPILEEKLLSGKILPLIVIDSCDKNHITPLPYTDNKIYISNEAQNQLIKYTGIVQGEKYPIVLIYAFETKAEEEQEKKHINRNQIGILAYFKTIFPPSLVYPYLSSQLEIVPEKVVAISNIQRQEHKGEYEDIKYTYYCDIQDIEYEIKDREKLHIAIINAIEVFRQCEYSELYVPRYNKDLIDNINYVAQLSILMIFYRSRGKIKECISLLKIQNLEKRFEAIRLRLLDIVDSERKKIIYENASQANSFIKEVGQVPPGFNIALFNWPVEEYLSLFTSTGSLKSTSILTLEQIEQAYYSKENKENIQILLIKESAAQFDETSIIPSVLAKVNNILIKEDGNSELYITPKKRVKVTEVVLKDSTYYGKVEEIIEPKANTLELNTLRKLVDKLITTYQTDEDISDDRRMPVFNQNISNFETYAANICFYMAGKHLGLDYTIKGIGREFLTRNTIEKLSFFIDYIEKLNEALDNIKKGNISEYYDKEALEALYNKAKNLNEQGKYKESLEYCNKGLFINPSDQDFLIIKNDILSKMCQMALEEDYECLIQNLQLSLPAKNIAIKELNIIKSLNSNDNDRADHIKYLRNILSLPWGRYNPESIDLKKAEEILNQEHYGLEEVKNRILESLVFIARSTHTKPPILCLVGPPGVGKTSIARSIANALERKFINLSFAGGNDASLIKGCMSFYRGSQPGKILSLLTEANSSNPVMVLDEIDKIDYSRGNGLQFALLQLLDPEQNSKFTDDYFDFPFDLSKVFFITTANSIDNISYPLINRMEIIELSGYTDQEKLQITNNYLMPKLLKEANLSDIKLGIDDVIIKYLIKHYTKESGVRDIKKTLRIILQKYLVDETKGNKPVITLDLIEKYLGTPKYHNTPIDQTARVGAAVGLAYTARGGSIMTVEVEKFIGEGKIKATGKLGEVLKESIEAAFAYIKANAEILAISPQSFKKYDLHVHLPEGAVAKDGPSAGITIYVALASLLSGKEVRQDVAMTGELTLKGKVLPIGGLKEKLSAAVRENIKMVVIPEGNLRDLAKIPIEIKDELVIKTVSNVKELLNIVS